MIKEMTISAFRSGLLYVTVEIMQIDPDTWRVRTFELGTLSHGASEEEALNQMREDVKTLLDNYTGNVDQYLTGCGVRYTRHYVSLG